MQRSDPSPAVYFLSDYGTVDEFVGVVHAVLHTLAPAVPIIDLGHQVPAFDVEAGAAMLVRCAPYLAAGVVLAVVDPGVGTTRRGVVVEPVGPGPSWLVGPDNGLLGPMAGALGGVHRVFALRSASSGPWPSTEAVGQTFDGRDLFAPAAAHLVLGAPPTELGHEVDPASLVSSIPDQPLGRPVGDPLNAAGGVTGPSGTDLEAVVTWIDRFGNVQLGAGPGALHRIGVDRGGRALVTPPRTPVRSELARRVDTFGDLEAGALGVLVDSTGRLALVLNRASAADHLAPVVVGDTVRITPDRTTEAPG